MITLIARDDDPFFISFRTFFPFFCLSLAFLFFFLFSAERIDCWLRSRLIGLDAKDRG